MMISGPLFSAIIIECIGVLTWGLYYSRGILQNWGCFFFVIMAGTNVGWSLGHIFWGSIMIIVF